MSPPRSPISRIVINIFGHRILLSPLRCSSSSRGRHLLPLPLSVTDPPSLPPDPPESNHLPISAYQLHSRPVVATLSSSASSFRLPTSTHFGTQLLPTRHTTGPTTPHTGGASASCSSLSSHICLLNHTSPYLYQRTDRTHE